MPNRNEKLQRLRQQVEAESSDGLKLLQNPADKPICTPTIDASVPSLCVTWKRYVTSAQSRFVHESILDMLERHDLDRILGDDTALPTIHTEDRQCITQEWMPRGLAAGLRAVAGKRPAAYFGKLSTDSIQKQARAGLSIQFFSTLEDAKDWLKIRSQPSHLNAYDGRDRNSGLRTNSDNSDGLR